MKIAVEGCAHGDLDNIYATVQHLERTENTKIDLLICCGDFQAVRNQDDLESLACPVKYRSMNSFWKYYSGQKVAPYPTVFVGGNHEASNYLWELYYGGWVAKNIYFLGFAGVINFGGIRIGGLSGIYKPHDYHSGHYERAPYNGHDIRSVYHVRSYDVLKLMQIEESLDVFISHDWPRGITKFGNKQELLRKKPFFEKEVEANTLGSVPAEQLLHKLRPSYWFSAHLHTKFAALVQHPGGTTSTKFLALDKCLPKRQFLQVVEFPEATGALEFTFDEEWLSITRAFDPYFPLTRRRSSNQFANVITKDELRMHREWVQHALQVHGKAIPLEFAITAPPYNPSDARIRRAQQKAHFRNQHTEQFLKLLALPYKLDAPEEAGYEDPGGNFMVPGKVVEDPNEIQLAEDGALDDPNEVPLDDSDTER